MPFSDFPVFPFSSTIDRNLPVDALVGFSPPSGRDLRLPRRLAPSPSLARTSGCSNPGSSPPEPFCAPQRLQLQSPLHARATAPEGAAFQPCWTEGASFCPGVRSRRSTPSANRSVTRPAHTPVDRSPPTRRAVPRNSETCQGCFTPATLSSFHLQGFAPRREQLTSP